LSAIIFIDGTYTEYITVWVDWNQDQDFTADERYEIGTCNTNGCIITGNITVPANALLGNTRMRVFLRYNQHQTNPCEPTFLFGEVEDYTVNVLAAPSCVAPSALQNTSLTSNSASISWTAGGTETSWEVEYGVFGFTQGAGTLDTVTTNSFSASNLLAETNYSFYVRAICSSSSVSAWSGPFNVFTGYCVSTSTSSASYVDNFTTTGGVTNISSLASGFGTGGYQNLTNLSVSQFEGATINFSAGFVGTTVGFAIWVDWNNDLVFDASERVFNTGAFVAAANGSFTVPQNTPLGNYRMRIRCDWNATSPTPCGNVARAETEDYTLSVVPIPTCFAPTALQTTSVSANSAAITWTPSGAENFWEIEYGPVGFTQGTGTIVGSSITTPTISNLTPETNYSVYVKAICAPLDSSAWAGPFNFTTPCLPSGLPFVEDFESFTTIGNNLLPDCWDFNSITTATPALVSRNVPVRNNIGARSGTNYYSIQWSRNVDVFTPGVELIAGQSYDFSFWYAQTDASNGFTITMAIGNNKNMAAMDTVGQIVNVINTTYQQFKHTFIPTTSGVYYLGINTNGTGAPWHMVYDDFSINETPFDVAINSVINPVNPIVAGNQNIEVEIENLSVVNIDSVSIGWALNGVVQNTSTVVLNPALAPGLSTTVIVDNAVLGTSLSELTVFLAAANGIVDDVQSNDTVSVNICGTQSGTFTVGGTNPDFATLTEAVNFLNCGIEGFIIGG
jgi:hypothetical protein